MTTSFYAGPYDQAFANAEAFLAKGRNKTNRPLQSNTRLVRINDDTIAVVLHSTAVVTYHRAGHFTIYGGGWNTRTTKDRIGTYSPCNPGSDGHGSWIVGWTGERTAPKVQKCRSCKGKPTWQDRYKCHGPLTYMPQYCKGGEQKHTLPRPYSFDMDGYDGPLYKAARVAFEASAYDQPCSHGEMKGHHTEPCEHGRWGSHLFGEPFDCKCYRCEGTGKADYGSKPIPVLADAHTAFTVDAEGKYLGPSAYKPTAAGVVATAFKKAGGWHDPHSAAGPSAYEPAPKPAGYKSNEIMAAIAQVVPNIMSIVKHPATGVHTILKEVVITLNDTHGWTREEIADWLDTLDLDLSLQTA